MRPLDPRLLRYARSSRGFLVLGAVLALADTLAIIGFAWGVTASLTHIIDGASWQELAPSLGGIAACAAARALLSWGTEATGARGAARAKSELRMTVLTALPRLGAEWLENTQSARLTTLLGHGLDALDDYFARYLPQLIRTAITLPALALVVFGQDLLSGIILLVTLPIIPIFMVLIGLATRTVQRRQWDGLNRLSASFLDVVGGLSTLKVFGREKRQIDRMSSITDDYRRSTMAVLRISFLSGFVLELMASLSVALLAVSIGFRLVDGAIPLTVGLFVLLLAPEVFLPIRQVGTHFHAAAEGVEASQDAFEILDAAEAAPEPQCASLSASGDLELRDVTVVRDETAVLEHQSLRARCGSVLAITGDSGAGKSTLLRVIAGLTPHTGSVHVGGVDMTAVSPGERSWLSWAPQNPALQAGTVLSNVTLGDPAPDVRQAERALQRAAAGDIKLDRNLGTAGMGLSGGEAQRVGLARCYYRAQRFGAHIIVLDEPTSALDRRTEQIVARGLRELAAGGACVIVVSHRPALVEWADECITIGDRAEVLV
ncbi:thiol reductant ABC exporter subunit CydD [Microbacterium sp. MPKO10]|uniref:thiol reductant ABC exporter subunit CydD n=1 Tax=Microbacterium sp. MPKO10 TaxID=2989818 RepID=UPI002236244E|nr:thiol reductant ABC exporter subunit CydD [Microbacterium sp. MPKO10]MCW4459666.1 thiol reductant ABC exporter subunit CydD [Microbacterium sp. MPKO10]